MSPEFSIVIPCYNHGHYIREAIQSVEQCKDRLLYEIIIVNDGSTDEHTIKVMDELKQEGYFVIDQHNQGLGASRNNGIRMAKGKYILPLDSDNRIRPEYFYESKKILDRNKDIAVVYGNAEYFGDKTGIWQVRKFSILTLMMGNYIDACAVFRKSAWKASGGYDEKMPYMGCEDWDFWLTLAFRGYRFQHVNKVLFDYRVLSNSMIRKLGSTEIQTLENYLHKKHPKWQDDTYIKEVVAEELMKEKRLVLKMFFISFFPWLVKLMMAAGLIKSKKIL